MKGWAKKDTIGTEIYRFWNRYITFLFVGIDQNIECLPEVAGIQGENQEDLCYFVVGPTFLRDQMKRAYKKDTECQCPY